MDKVDPDDVNKSPRVIRDAKEEIGKIDVLVCGECHSAFHYINEFQEHKEKGKCSGSLAVRDSFKNELEPQIWAFMIWKHAHLNQLEGDGAQSSWLVYQKWCKLDPKEKGAWIIAAKNLQSFSKISNAKVQEVKTVVNKNKSDKPNNSVSRNISGDDLSEDGESSDPKLPKAVSSVNKGASSTQKSENNTDQNAEKSKQTLISKPTLNQSGKVIMRKALRTSKDDDIDEAIIEKILGRRLNHKKKCTEYFIKWENMPESENTWEPKIHLIKCRVLLEEFDRAIDKKKMAAQQAAKSVENQLEEMESELGRPQRTSKQKALNQVKVWCGDMSEGEEGSVKRGSFSDDDSSDSFEKKMRFDDETDSSEDEKPSAIKKLSKSQGSLNGVAKKSLDNSMSATPRVVRVSQKELPNLSSGVYIMSKTDGIVKLDSNNSSPGHSMLKVGSKIGQTHIKMVKKDEQATKPTVGKFYGPPDKKFSPTFPRGKVTPQKKVLTPLSINKSATKAMDSLDSLMDDESDGVEELEFPTNLPLPSPDSPPGEFTLCPLTGRVLGGPDVPEVEELKEGEVSKEHEDTANDNTSLDALVKLAAAELPDVDLDGSEQGKKAEDIKKEPSFEEEEPVADNDGLEKLIKIQPTTAATATDLEASIKPLAIERSTNIIMNVDDSLTSQPKSALSSTLTNVQLQNSPRLTPSKKLLSTPTLVRQKVSTFQQRQVIQRPAMTKPVPTAIIHKVSSNRNKPAMSRSLQDTGLTTVKRSTPISTYRPANVARRIGNTTIYKTEKTPPPPTLKRIPTTPFKPPIQRTMKPSTVSSIQTQPTPKVVAASMSPTVINMPLLTPDDDTPVIAGGSTDATLAEVPTLTSFATDSEVSELPTINLSDSETPLLITADDGTIYQVAGQNEEGQTILISEGPDGQQQCVIVSSEFLTDEVPVEMHDPTNEPEQMEVDQPLTINTQPDVEDESAESEDSHVVAQIIKADPPSPGGTRKVVLMLPDGNLMMTDVTAEQFAALELDK